MGGNGESHRRRADTSPDTLAALRAASTFCSAEIDRKGQPRSNLAQRGIAWQFTNAAPCRNELPPVISRVAHVF